MSDDAVLDTCTCGAQFIPLGQQTRCWACVAAGDRTLDELHREMGGGRQRNLWRREIPIETLGRRLLAYAPNATIKLDRPSVPNGTWFLDVNYDGETPITVAWQRKNGFGLICHRAEDGGTGGYTHQVDQSFYSMDEALTRSLELIRPGDSMDVLLRMIRQRLPGALVSEKQNVAPAPGSRWFDVTYETETVAVAWRPDGIGFALMFTSGDYTIHPDTTREEIGQLADQVVRFVGPRS